MCVTITSLHDKIMRFILFSLFNSFTPLNHDVPLSIEDYFNITKSGLFQAERAHGKVTSSIFRIDFYLFEFILVFLLIFTVRKQQFVSYISISVFSFFLSKENYT